MSISIKLPVVNEILGWHPGWPVRYLGCPGPPQTFLWLCQYWCEAWVPPVTRHTYPAFILVTEQFARLLAVHLIYLCQKRKQWLYLSLPFFFSWLNHGLREPDTRGNRKLGEYRLLTPDEPCQTGTGNLLSLISWKVTLLHKIEETRIHFVAC